MAKQTIPRASRANTFEDAKLRVKEVFEIPVKDVATAEDEAGSMFLDDDSLISYRSRNNTIEQVATVDMLSGFLRAEEVSGLFPVTYKAPTVLLSTTTNLLNLEVGQSINMVVQATFVKNDGGDLISMDIQKDGTSRTSSNTYTENGMIVSAGFNKFQAFVEYGQGPVKNNVAGIPVPVGRIPAGEAASNIIYVEGYYIFGYGSVASVPAGNNVGRNLPVTRLSNVTGSFDLIATGLMQVLLVPPDKSLEKVIDLDAMNIDLTKQYAVVNDNFVVNNAAGVPVSGYELRVRTQGTPYTNPHRHQVTFKPKS